MRTLVHGGTNTMYCEFLDSEEFVEYYDLAADPWNLKNLAKSTPPAQLKTMSAALAKIKACSGADCRST